jgi:hypothetical protein
MEMGKNWPVWIFIDGVGFILDREQQAFVLAEARLKNIPFRELKDEGSFYTMKFNRVTKQIAKPEDRAERHLKQILIPKNLVGKDTPLNVDLINKLSDENEWGFMLAGPALMQRLMGKLPVIDIAGKDYIVDWRLREFRAADDPLHSISLRQMVTDDSGESYLFFYNKATHKVYEVDMEMKALPENVVLIEMPFELRLDPVRVARENGLSDIAMLREYPIQENLRAIEIPLSETGLPKLVELNLAKALLEEKNNKSKDEKQSRGKRIR